MTRLLILSAALVILPALGAGALGRPGTLDTSPPQETPAATCAKAATDCQRSCDACAAHCASMVAAGKKTHLATLQTCLDCADLCAATARIVARGGPFAGLIAEICAETCLRTAAECEKAPDDAVMKSCAEECRRCEKACRDFLKTAPPHGDHSGHRDK